MRERRRTIIAGLTLVAAIAWLQSAPLVTIETDIADRAPATTQAAVDLGMLGTVVLSWTFKQVR